MQVIVLQVATDVRGLLLKLDSNVHTFRVFAVKRNLLPKDSDFPQSIFFFSGQRFRNMMRSQSRLTDRRRRGLRRGALAR